MNDTIITILGQLTADPELRFTPSGAPVANFSIASTPRYFDKQANEWKDGDTLFLRCSLWRQPAENVAESLTRGMRVIAQGRLKQRSYEKDGEKRTVIELEVDDIGPSLKMATAVVTKTARQGGGQSSGQGGGKGEDPWASAPAASKAYDDEPPFLHGFADARPWRSRPGRPAPDGPVAL